ncbi:uncharacterized protein LOC116050863 isoform X2 [Sander lucioperca]|uniref:uncharacterized protein LOC116050863 isoform X2 n=1 Tax=Sander lucioperca TaxID=283035 RepID=UPI00125DDE5F|nr:uncharacterized protein LOC116050863 isoform X2 [Sander lucioperca]
MVRRGEQARVIWTDGGLRMDFNPSPPDLFHPSLPNANVNSSQPGAWRCTHHNKKIRAERGAMSKRASSHKLFPVLLMVGWIVGCTAVVYLVFIFAWKRGVQGRN